MELLPQLIILGRTALAMVLGGLIGIEREVAHKPAGFRTHMIVAGASALLMGMPELLVTYYRQAGVAAVVSTDPLRIMQGLIMGVCVLAGGAILRDKSSHTVKGLTTVVSMLLSGAIGIATGAGQFVLAGGTTLLGLLVLLAFNALERNFLTNRNTTTR